MVLLLPFPLLMLKLPNIQLSPEGEVNSGGYTVYIHCSSPTLREIVVLVFTKYKYGYSELWDPIKTRENCYPLFW